MAAVEPGGVLRGGLAALGPRPAPSRLPVRGTRGKRPAPAQGEAAAPAPPEQKRARPAGRGGGGRVPLKALSVGAAGRAATRPATAAPPRAGGPPAAAAAPPRAKRPPWDLRGQVEELRAALGGLERERGELRQRLEQGQQREALLSLRLGSLEAELQRCREEEERCRAEAEGLGAALQDREEQLRAAEAQVRELRAQAAAREQQLEQQQEQLHGLEMERRRLHNLVQELKGNIRVFCRVRPVLPEEEERQKGLEHLHFPPHDNTALVLSRPEESHVGRERRGDVRYDFSFDRVFPPAATQQEIFEEIALLVQSALDGYHVCIFAYGQTGSGKTYTMEGPGGAAEDTERRGVIPRAVGQVFRGAQELAEKGWEYHFSASFLEIYNESLRDLLAGKAERGAELEIRRVSAASEELHVPNLRCVPVASEEEVGNNPPPPPLSPNPPQCRGGGGLGVTGCLCVSVCPPPGAGAAADGGRPARGGPDGAQRPLLPQPLRLPAPHPRPPPGPRPALRLGAEPGGPGGQRAAGEVPGAGGTAAGDPGHQRQPLRPGARPHGPLQQGAHIPYRNSKLTYLLQNSLGGSRQDVDVCEHLPPGGELLRVPQLPALRQQGERVRGGHSPRQPEVAPAQSRPPSLFLAIPNKDFPRAGG